jgi:hypothetical protein|nr:MAG TPA: hypothetical protein [Caudoviricetes sp.]
MKKRIERMSRIEAASVPNQQGEFKPKGSIEMFNSKTK